MTTISILTPSYGYAHYIQDAIESVRRQETSATVEHIVADGGSTDGTQDVLREYPHVDWFSEPDEGQSDALNRALARSQSEIIGWLNADEFYLKGALEAIRRTFETASADVVYGDSAFVDEDGRLLRLVPQHRFSPTVLRHYGCYIPSCAFFVRRKSLPPDPWDPDLPTIMDWDLYLKLLRTGARFTYLPRVLGAFRVHDARVTARPLDKEAVERLVVRDRHGVTSRPYLRELLGFGGRSLHVLLKVWEGSYTRQMRATGHRGKALQWWPPRSGEHH